MSDILIVGAGPAGSSFAKFASEKGFEVTIIDSGDFSTLWSKPCGNGLVARSIKTLGIKPPSGKELYNVAKTVKAYSPDYSFSVEFPEKTYLINRHEFGKRLMRDAIKAGAVFIENTTFLDVLIEKGRVVGIKAKNKGKTKVFRANLIVDATGASARIKSKLPKKWPVAEPTRHKAICFRGIVELKEVKDPTTLKVYTDQSMAPNSYWWNFPQGQNQINLGLGVLPEYKKDLVKNYRAILSRLPVKKIIHEAGAYIPVSRPPPSLVGPGVLVLGDAAPTIDSLTGEGMGTSMEASYLAASKLDEVAGAGWTYEASWAMNEYLRNVGATISSFDVPKEMLWQINAKKLQNLMSMFKDRLNWFRLPFSPTIIKTVYLMKKLQSHYKNYPNTPHGIDKWENKLQKIYSSLKF